MPPLASIGRIVQSLDFERVLRTRSRGQSLHFAVHHLPDRPSLTARARRAHAARELSTGDAPPKDASVDNAEAPKPMPAVGEALWWGAVVPKRHAKRAVTRSLLKRQIRHAVRAHAASLPSGLWVVRLRAPFDRQTFKSAASDALKGVARGELDALLRAVGRGTTAASAAA